MRTLLTFLFVIVLAGCGGGGGGVGTPQTPDAVQPAVSAVTAEVLASGVFQNRYHYDYLRLTLPGKQPTYAIWFAPANASASASATAKAAAVLLTDPYAGIDWTGEAFDVDTARSVGSPDFKMIQDVRGPYFDAADPVYVPYDFSTIDNATGFAEPYLMNGIGVIIVYERYYGGGSLQNDIDDTLAGLEFLGTQPTIDRARIGVWGSSYGGSVALYAAANASKSVTPAFGALSTPLVDFGQFVPYAEWLAKIHSDPALAYLRLEPFRRRAQAAATAASDVPDYSPYSTASLVSKLSTKFLFLHDTFDTIAPLLHANTLYFGTPGLHQVFIYPHQNMALDWANLDVTHAPVKPGFDEASAILFSQAYLITRLTSSTTEVLLPRLPTLNLELFAYLRSQQELGFDANTFVLPRLLELCDARIQLVDYADGFAAREPGRRFVARLLKTYWRIDVDETNVLDYLQTKGL